MMRRIVLIAVAVAMFVFTAAPALAATEQTLTVPYQADQPANIDFTITPNPTNVIFAKRGKSSVTGFKITNTGTVPIRILARVVFPAGIAPDEYNKTGFSKDYGSGNMIPGSACPGSPGLSGNSAAVAIQLGYSACVYPGVDAPVVVVPKLDPGLATGIAGPDLRVAIALPNNYDASFPQNGEFQIIFTAEEVQ